MKHSLKELETVARKYQALSDCLTEKGKRLGLLQNLYHMAMEVFSLLVKPQIWPVLLFTEALRKFSMRIHLKEKALGSLVDEKKLL